MVINDEISGIEIEVWEGHQRLAQTSRQTFRLPVTDDDPVALQIDKQSYKVINISISGVGIQIQNYGLFVLGDEVGPIEIDLAGTKMKLYGKVSRINPLHEGEFICGITFVEIDGTFRNSIQSFIDAKLRAT